MNHVQSPILLRQRPLHVLRSAAGAFDLPSILVGVVVVGVLTAGVLAAIFGVIPFAQDKAAQQDLDGLRTAQGVAKAKGGVFMTSAGLADAAHLPAVGHVAADTDPDGSCYTAIALSGSGKLHVATSMAPAPIEMLDATSPGCVTSAQLKTLVESVGGVMPGGISAGVTYTPIVAAPGSSVRPGVVVHMNDVLAAYASNDVTVGLEALTNNDNAAADAAFELFGNRVAASQAVLANSAEDLAQYNDINNRTSPHLVALAQAYSAEADKALSEDHSVAQHQRMVDALYTLSQAIVDAAFAG